jgi:hypothetical protein
MGKAEKEVKRVGRQLERNVRKGLRSFDQEAGVQFQTRELSNLGKAIVGAPKIEQAKPAAPIKGDAIQPLAAMGAPRESQEAATKDLYRRRRARGVATGPAGLTGEASVRRKRLLGG